MNSLQVALGIAAAGGVGAALRYLVSWGLTALHVSLGGRPDRTWPWGTALVNVVGTALSAWVSRAASLNGVVGRDLAMILMIGFAGGFTTMSTAALELAQLWREKRDAAAALALLAPLAAASAACLLILLWPAAP